ncbi:ligand-binding sensor domain-containing protein [Paraflavitalea pollutisoli]|uniref:ligand-binding sensor domain-containing protein n=1 Tax=Paraflavitalea pollutisoli TaxID=3034143 RepID=UPI0023EB6651|nr:two-component regulator propeller domain-containing protein [Paraflavitalea sp. H1-2-19X]
MKHLLIYTLFSLAGWFSSCGQNPTNKPPENARPITDFKHNDTARLRYTTGVRAILEDSKGNTWFGSNREGVCMLKDGQLQYFTTQNGLSDNQVRSIYEDKNGIIWFECGVGLSKYDGKAMTVSREREYSAPKDRTFNVSDLWFKSDETVGYNKLEGLAGVYQYDGKHIYYRSFPIQPPRGHENGYSISTPFIKSKTGMVWMGTYNALIGYDGKRFTMYTDDSMGLDSTESLHIRAIMEDSKGNIWIGNNSGGSPIGGIGVIKYDGKQFNHFTKQQRLRKEDTKGNSLDRVFSIGEDSSGNMWFGTVQSGVWRYDGHTMTNFTQQDGLDGDMTWIIYKSKSGELWFGGGPNGVFRFNGKSFERKY